MSSGSNTRKDNGFTGRVCLLCDLTPVIEYFRKDGGQLFNMPEFVVYGTTAVFRGSTRGIELDPEMTQTR